MGSVIGSMLVSPCLKMRYNLNGRSNSSSSLRFADAGDAEAVCREVAQSDTEMLGFSGAVGSSAAPLFRVLTGLGAWCSEGFRAFFLILDLKF